MQPGIPVEATVRVKWAHHRMSMKATNVPACKPGRYTCKPARRFAACIDLVHACSSACMRDKVRACMLIDMYACTRPMVVCTMQIHAYTRDVRVCGTMRWLPAPTSRFAPWACRLPEQCAGFNERPPCVHVSVRPSVRQLLGRAEAGEFGGNGVQAFEDIVIVGFLGRGLFGEE